MKNWIIGLVVSLMLYNSLICPIAGRYGVDLPLIPVPEIVTQLAILVPLIQ
jgi:hypothetical protein